MKKISRTIVLMLLVVSVLMTSAITVFATTEKTSLLGDADLDGRVSICDATAIQKHVAQLKELSDDGILTGDVDNNGRVDIRDATSIQKHLVKLDCSYPIGEPVKPNEEETLPTVPDTENPTTPTEPDNNTPVTPDEENYRPIDPDTTDILTEQMLWEIEQEFYRLVNEERIWKGLEPLSYNQHLDDIAQIRSLEITELYYHTRPNG